MHLDIYIYRSTLLKVPQLKCSRYCVPQTAEPTRETTASAVRILPKLYVTNPIASNTWPIDALTITKPYFDDRERSYNSEPPPSVWGATGNCMFSSNIGYFWSRLRSIKMQIDHGDRYSTSDTRKRSCGGGCRSHMCDARHNFLLSSGVCGWCWQRELLRWVNFYAGGAG